MYSIPPTDPPSLDQVKIWLNQCYTDLRKASDMVRRLEKQRDELMLEYVLALEREKKSHE